MVTNRRYLYANNGNVETGTWQYTSNKPVGNQAVHTICPKAGIFPYAINNGDNRIEAIGSYKQ